MLVQNPAVLQIYNKTDGTGNRGLSGNTRFMVQYKRNNILNVYENVTKVKAERPDITIKSWKSYLKAPKYFEHSEKTCKNCMKKAE
ncbi:MAG TPA: hypothetical protein DCZ78_11880 [Blautia sp.]|uniref:hypothetical protein n=1 Tax=Blautia sp. TaxID=1955243 RepID=UPI000E99404F|nr:hypothetical protein [Blautia sp.]HBB47499.1 hypothetical protein [Blautia sp.]